MTGSGEKVAVKICGLTNLEDARHAWRAGADLMGFVLVPGTPRYVDASRAAAIVDALRGEGCGALMVGVFGHAPPATVRAAVSAGGFDLVQLHGDPPPTETADLGAPALIARRIRGAMGSGRAGAALGATPRSAGSREAEGFAIDWASLAAYRAWGYVLDGYDAGRLGGTGRTWDWRLAAGRPEGLRRTLIAGGLTPDNVAEAVGMAKPWGVDVSSGVEAAPGRKDPERVARFIERAKGA